MGGFQLGEAAALIFSPLSVKARRLWQLPARRKAALATLHCGAISQSHVTRLGGTGASGAGDNEIRRYRPIRSTDTDTTSQIPV